MNLLKKLLSAHIETTSYYELRRIYLVNTLLLSGIIILGIFATMHGVQGNYQSFIFDLFFLITLAFSYGYILQSKSLVWGGHAAALFLLCFLLYLPIISEATHYSLVWSIAFPIFAIVYYGPKNGLMASIGFYFLLFSLLAIGIGTWHNNDWNTLAFIHFSISSIVLTILFYAAESSLMHYHLKNKKIQADLEKLSTTDYLTKLLNRRGIMKRLEGCVNKHQQAHDIFSIAIIDIDDFKQINDQHGHNVGDQVLLQLAEIFSHITNTSNHQIVGRWGGEEFIIIYPKTCLEQALGYCQALRNNINNFQFKGVKGQAIHCSFGLSEFTQNNQTIDCTINEADMALYQAKESGKNKIITFQIQSNIF